MKNIIQLLIALNAEGCDFERIIRILVYGDFFISVWLYEFCCSDGRFK